MYITTSGGHDLQDSEAKNAPKVPDDERGEPHSVPCHHHDFHPLAFVYQVTNNQIFRYQKYDLGRPQSLPRWQVSVLTTTLLPGLWQKLGLRNLRGWACERDLGLGPTLSQGLRMAQIQAVFLEETTG